MKHNIVCLDDRIYVPTTPLIVFFVFFFPSFSTIRGGINVHIDDISGHIIGKKVGLEAFSFGEKYFAGEIVEEDVIFPNPADEKNHGLYKNR